jgi:protein-tyrosine phosphatase
MKDIYWIRHEEHPRLAIVARPRADDRLEDDLGNLKRGGIEILVSLLMPEEAVEYGLAREGEIAKRLGIQFISYPVTDSTTPTDAESFRLLITQLADAMRADKHVGVHCRGCIGRSAVMTAAVLIDIGFQAAEALALIEDARGCPVPETREQRNWILQFEPER